MTMTPSASRARTARALGLRARLSLAVTTLIALVAAGAPVSAAAADRPPATVPLTFTVAVEGEGLVRPDGQLIVAMAADNPGTSTVSAGRVDIAVSRAPLASRAEVGAWLDGEAQPAMRGVGSEMLDSIAARGTGTASTSLSVGDALDPGVYALEATYHSAQGPIVSAAVWVVPGDEPASGTVTVVVPITAGPLERGLLTATELEELTAPGGRLRTQLEAVTGLPAVLAVDPAVVASIRVLGTTAPVSASEWLDDLLALPHERFALQFGDADLAAQFGAGLSRPLDTPALTRFIAATGFTAGEPEPDISELTDIAATRADVYWPASGTAGVEVVGGLGALASDSATAPLTMVPSDTVAGESGVRAAAGDAHLLVYDAPLSAALHTASVSERRIDRSAALAEAAAFSFFTDPATPLLVTIDRADARPTAGMRAVIGTATSIGGRDAAGLDTVATGDAVDVTVSDIPYDPERVAALERFLSDEGDIAQFATILSDPSLLTGSERASVMQLMGNAWLDRPQSWRDAVDAHREQTRATLGSVTIVPTPDVNLLGASAPLTFSVRNDLPWPVSLVLVTVPNDPRLLVQTTTEVTAGELQTTRVDVPVQARVGSGESSLDLQLRSPTMIAIGDSVTVAVAVRAEWEAVGIVIMVFVVGGLFVLGVIRTVLRMRRRRESDPTAPDAGGTR